MIKKPQTYTVKFHAYRLKMMLMRMRSKRKRLTLTAMCPATKGFNWRYVRKFTNKAEKCSICKQFIGTNLDAKCPCHELGTSEALRRTEVALKNFDLTYKKFGEGLNDYYNIVI